MFYEALYQKEQYKDELKRNDTPTSGVNANTRRIQLTKDDFDALSKIGISYRGAAFILGVSAPCVSQKVKEYGIDWIGKDKKILMQFIISVFCLG